jgi:putative endonuclease
MLRQQKCWYVYILSSLSGTLYVGMTDNLVHRMGEHRQGLIEGFTKKYKVSRLMYFETFRDPRKAAMREKQIKGYRRQKKIAVFTPGNPNWKDLTEEIYRSWAL